MIVLIGAPKMPLTGQSLAFNQLVESKKILSYQHHVIYLPLSNGWLKWLFSTVRNIYRINRNNYDTIYLQAAQSRGGLVRDFVYLIGPLLRGKRVILHTHGGGYSRLFNDYKGLKILSRYIYSSADTIIVLSNSLVAMFPLYIRKHTKIAVIHNGVNLPKQDFSFGLDSKKVVFFSNIIRTKGIYEFIEATEIIAEDCQDMRLSFVIAGKILDSREAKIFQSTIQKASLKGIDLRCLGPVYNEDKELLLQQSDIFVLPTYYPNEGQPISILEAMSNQTLVISTYQGGIPDIISNNTNGILVKDVSGESIADAIKYVVYNPDLTMLMKKNAFQTIKEQFDVQTYILKTLKMLE